ncbi:MAG TPA: hypothetical protein VEZ90_17520, partial [Blastocatellia bacterium]|nr:hypothetical protein [Blastocatellia bacterium]
MMTKLFVLALIAVLVTSALVATAQQSKPVQAAKPPAAEPSDNDTITFDSAVVNTYVTVRDANGSLVSGLTRDDFKILDNGKEQPINYFSRESNQPLRVVLVIDRSRSVQRELA